MPKKQTTFNILAIETSCDETAAAILNVDIKAKPFPKIQTLSSVVNSQIKLHSKMGGVVPEVAARAHIKNILPVVKKSLKDADAELENIDFVAVTAGPGLIPSLLVGVEFAKGLGFALNKPVIPINHLMGHLYSPFREIQNSKLKTQNVFPMISLIVSGGHTILSVLKNETSYRVLGETVDDAAGEAFDKVAKLLSLPYPGGPEVSKLAKQGTASINFPRPMTNSKDYNFSFSGLKTAVRYYLENHKLKIKNQKLKADVCASFQQAVVDVLVVKTMKAAKEFKAKSISLSGGVSANQSLRQALTQEAEKSSLRFFVPPLNLCTDNAEMIGLAAAFQLYAGFKPVSYKKVQADSNLSL